MYKFIKTLNEDNQYDHDNVTMEIPYNDISLSDLVESFERFLLSCGFSFTGHLDIIEEE